jgi:ATP/maltotriose-dependent transcriptional regulator MalT
MGRHVRGPYIRAARHYRAPGQVDWDSINPTIEEFAKEHNLGFRETQCIVAAAHSMSNQMIADEFHVALDTVKTQLRHVYRKIGVNDRAGAVHWAWQNGLFGREAA